MAYTVQQIKVALELYDKIKKIVPTVRQLGYPSVHTLYEWINQREATGGKSASLKTCGVRNYGYQHGGQKGYSWTVD